MSFAQLVVGPPGSGKSTYCHGIYQFLSAIGRKAAVVNLDPANDRVPYPVAIDIRDYIKLEDIMKEAELGPNGGVLYALEQAENNWENELVERIKTELRDNYVIFDCPGQVELFTHHLSLKRMFSILEKNNYRLVVVNLIDSLYLTSASQYLSVLLLTLRTMLQMDLPQVNVVSKIDLLSNYGPLDFNLDFYTEAQDLYHLYPLIEQECQKHGQLNTSKYAKLTEAIAEIVSDFGLVQFQVLSIDDKPSMIRLLSVIDKATGYLFGATEIGGDTVWAEATRQGGYGNLADEVSIQERWIDFKDEYDALEQEKRRQQATQGEPEGEADFQESNETFQEDFEKEYEKSLKEWQSKHKENSE